MLNGKSSIGDYCMCNWCNHTDTRVVKDAKYIIASSSNDVPHNNVFLLTMGDCTSRRLVIRQLKNTCSHSIRHTLEDEQI